MSKIYFFLYTENFALLYPPQGTHNFDIKPLVKKAIYPHKNMIQTQLPYIESFGSRILWKVFGDQTLKDNLEPGHFACSVVSEWY